MRLCIFFISILFNIISFSQPGAAIQLDERIDDLIAEIDSLRGLGEFENCLSLSEKAVEISINDFTKESQEFIFSAYNHASVFFALEKYKESIPLFEDVIEVIEKSFEGKHDAYSMSLSSLAYGHVFLSQYDLAEKYAMKSMDLAEKDFGRNTEAYSHCLSTLVHIFYSRGWYKLAADSLKISIDIYEKAVGADNPEYAKKISNLGVLYDISGQYKKSFDCYEKSVALTETHLGKNHPHYALRLNRLGGAHRNQGNYYKALNLFKESEALIEKNIGKEHPRYVEILNSLGTTHSAMEQYETALAYLLKSFELSLKVMGEDHPFTQQQYEAIGQLHVKLGDYSKALTYLEKGLEISRKNLGEEHRDNFRKIMAVGTIYQRLGQTEKAFSMLTEAKRLIEKLNGKEHFDYCEIIQPLSDIYLEKGNQKEAFSLKNEAVEIIEKIAGKEHPLYSFYLGSLAGTYVEIGEFEKGIDLNKRAMKIAESNFGKDHSYYHAALSNLATAYNKSGRKNEAINAYSESLNFYENKYGKDHQITGDILKKLGDIHWEIGQLDSAADFYERALENYQNQLQNYYPFLSENERLIYIRRIETATDEISSFALSHPNFAPHLQNMLLEMKGKALDYSIQAKKDAFSSAADSPELAEAWNEWKALERKIEKYLLSSVSDSDSKNAFVNLDSLQDVANRLEGKISEQMNLRIAKNQTFDNADIQKSLSEKEAAVNFFHFNFSQPNQPTDSVFYCALITKTNTENPKLVKICEEKDLENLLSSNVAVNSDNYLANSLKNSQLYDLIWKPIQPYLDEIEEIHLSPSGLLHQVAFDVLKPNPERKAILFDDVRLTYHGNLRDFVKQKSDSKSKNIVLVGGAIFDLDSTALTTLRSDFESEKDEMPNSLKLTQNSTLAMRSVANDSTRAGVIFNYLPDSKREVENIHNQFVGKGKNSRLFIGKTALEDNIKSLSGGDSPDILHLATHGYFFKPFESENTSDHTLRARIIGSENPLVRSGLVFTGVNHTWLGGTPIPGLDDGVLTAYEISNLDLFHTQLAVLSACETGRGDVHDAEGVFGLQRAFKTAGVDQLIISLWKVPDRATSEMMTLFYKYYLKGKSVNEAFRKARKKMRKKYEPYYWGAFVLIE